MKAPVIRISIGFFDADKAAIVEKSLLDSKSALEPGIRAMRGYLGFSAGIDRENNAIINVSGWKTVADAKQLATFQPMLDLGREFTTLGIRFQRPILNFETIWESA